jgi:Rieske Fe-S protein
MASVAAVLTGCSADASKSGDSSGVTASGGTPPSTAGASSSAAAGASSSAAPGASSLAAVGEELASASEIPVGGGKIFDKQRVVVTQPIAGEFKAFSAICTHTGCIVSGVSDGVIACACHGSLFSASDGSVKNGPATEPLPARTVALRDQNLYLQ